jgi:sugar transferase (PEP-CTERM/EpsH1 system associated)
VKLLWAKSGGLVPLDTGGKTRSFNLLKELGRKHEVSLFTFYGAHENDMHGTLAQQFSHVVSLPVRLPAQRSVLEAVHYARNLFTRQPYSLSKYTLPEAARELRKLLEGERYDVLICDFLFCAPIVPWDVPVPKILFAHNVETQIWNRHYQVARNPIWKAVALRESQTMKQAERRYLELADHVLTVSEQDKKFFATFLPAEKLTVIPTGVDLEYFRPSMNAPAENRLVFTGSMDWMPNEDAILYFLEKILPEIRKETPDTTISVVGRYPTARLRTLASGVGGVEITGTVEDVRPFVWDATVYVVPLRVGGGTRIKIFEAMAMGKPIVSTPVGAEGLRVEHGKNILLAESPKDFASHVVRLLRTKEESQKLGLAARALVQHNFSWAAVSSTFEDVFAKLACDAYQTVDECAPPPSETPASAT